MIYKIKTVIILVLTVSNLVSQNLVPNPSFEEYIDCPYTYGRGIEAIGWNSVPNHLGSPDYFNSCDTTNIVSVPINVTDTQYSATGNAHLGIWLVGFADDYREYVEVKLKKPLLVNTGYYISFKYTLSDNSRYATDGMGIYLSQDEVFGDSNDFPISVIPQLNSTVLLDNKDEWVTMEFYYTATGGEQYLTFGNFKTDSSSTIVDLGKFKRSVSYIYFDDVAVIEDSCQFKVDLGNDTVLCEGDILTLDASLPLTTSYSWQDMSTSSTLSVYRGGMYWVNTINECGMQNDSIYIELDDCKCTFYIPNSFTPNTDYRNEYFYPIPTCYMDKFAFRIYNRWGDLIFNTDNQNQYWDGTFNNIQAPTGMYTYKLEYTFRGNKSELMIGSFSLLR